MSKLEFWFDFASTYSYLTAMRIDRLGAEAGIEIVWRPFLLGPIFAAQGWNTSPFNLYPAKGRYMVRDIQRIAEARGIAFVMPQVFPARSLMAARTALAFDNTVWSRQFSRAVFEAQFQRGADISDTETLKDLIAGSNSPDDPASILECARSERVKQRLRAQSERAVELGIFGAPTLVATDGELFWGDDRAEQAVVWAQQL